MEGRFVLLLRKLFRRYRCDAAIDAAGNAIVDAGGVAPASGSVNEFVYELLVANHYMIALWITK